MNVNSAGAADGCANWEYRRPLASFDTASELNMRIGKLDAYSRIFLLLGGICAASLACSSPSQAATQVDLKLVLATDVSGSIDNEEMQLEREGTADAFASPEVIKAIQSGTLGRIAVAMFDFSSPEFNKVVIDWQIIHDRASAAAFAEQVRAAPRSPGRRTSVSSALETGTDLIESSDRDIVSMRKVIDVSGDGPNNDGNPMTEVHDRTIAKGIVVNGLPVMDEMANGYYRDLDKYYAACVIGGQGSFVTVVHSYKDYATAMRHKLVLEISRNDVPDRQATNEAGNDRLLIRIADPPPAVAPQILRPGANEFSGHCDIQGGGGFGGFGGGFPYFNRGN
jgi:hypothetical protein